MGSKAIVHPHVDEVLVARLLVGEGDGLELCVAEQAGEHRLRRCLCSETPEHARLLAVDDDVELGRVLLARDLHVGEQPAASSSVSAAQLARELFRVARAVGQIVAEDLDVDRRGRPEVQDPLHDAAGEEEDLRAGHRVGEGRAHLFGRLHVADGPLARAAPD